MENWIPIQIPASRCKAWSGVVATLLVMLFALSTVHAQEAAQPASSFLDSIGIGAGLSFNPPFPCANYVAEKNALVALGVRHIRSGETGPVAIAAYQDLANSGIKTMLCIDANYGVRPDSSFWINAPGSDSAGWGDPSPGYNVHDFVKQVGPGTVVDSVEMANEIDCGYSQTSQYWRPSDYPLSHISSDPTSPLYWVNYIDAATQASYVALKSDPATAMVSVVGNALGGTYRAPTNPNPLAPGSLYSYTDYGGFHPYPGWSDPAYSSATLLNYYAANYQTPFMQFDSNGNLINARSMVASETGYATGTGSGATSEVVQGKYIPRLFCEAYTAGIARTFVYCLFDNGSGMYGLLHSDFTPKPAYTALANLLGVLSDNSTSFAPGSLAYSLTVSPVNNYTDPLTGITANYGTGNVHHLLLQKSDGTFDLLLWNEIPDQTGSASGTITEQEPPALPASISLPGNVGGANLYTLNDDGSMQCTNEQVVNGVINFTIRDTVEVLHVSASGAPTTAATVSGNMEANNCTYFGSATVTLTASDSLGAGNIAGTYYTVDGGTTLTYTAPFTITTLGTHSVSYWSSDKLGNVESPHLRSIIIVPNAETIPSVLQINCAGGGVGAFRSDAYFSGGSVSSTASPVSTAGVAIPAPSSAYQCVRFGQFAYTLPGLTAGTTYTLRLHFSELYWNAANCRLFNVTANGQKLLSNFDVFLTAGGKDKAVVESFPVMANASGQIVLQFATVKDNAELSAIEVVPQTGATAPAPPAPAPTPVSPVAPATVQINCGSSQTGTFHGDMDFTGGSVGAYANPVSTTGVTNPAPALAYQTERFGNFTYTIPNLTPGGSYTLRLHFAEIYWNQANARLFNVVANGTTLLSNFDVFATAGGKNRAIVESFPVTADSSGRVVVQFVTVKNNAKVSAIELVPAS